MKYKQKAKVCPGARFGMLTVIEFLGKEEGRYYWKVRCDCGTEKKVILSSIYKSQSCGCARKNLTKPGTRFGMWVVQGLSHVENGNYYYDVKCDCGTLKKQSKSNLKRTQSCGCLKLAFKEKHHGWNGVGDLYGCFVGRIKQCAKSREIEWDVSPQYLWDLYQQQGGKCALSGLLLHLPTSSKGVFSGESTASLDRISSGGGYTENNVQWVHKDLQAMKFTLEQDRFFELCEVVVEFRKKIK